MKKHISAPVENQHVARIKDAGNDITHALNDDEQVILTDANEAENLQTLLTENEEEEQEELAENHKEEDEEMSDHDDEHEDEQENDGLGPADKAPILEPFDEGPPVLFGIGSEEGPSGEGEGVENNPNLNVAPTANPDTNKIKELMGVTDSPDNNVSGNVLLDVDHGGGFQDQADTDPNGTPLEVTTTGVFAGKYGQLTLNADGSYTYELDDSNALVNALDEGDLLSDEVFLYTITDGAATADSTLTITIEGTNDGPTANNDAHAVTEAMDANDAPIISGNVIAANVAHGNATVDNADTDPDADDVLTVTKVVDGMGNDVAIGVGDTNVEGDYGTLTIKADGTYSYDLKDDQANVNELDDGEMVFDNFVYTIIDTGGKTATATLDITINGANDSPVATADMNMVTEGTDASPAADISGNVIAGDANGGVVDTDPDEDDNANTLKITKVVGDVTTQGDGSTVIGDGSVIEGTYGDLTMNADGSYSYDLKDDQANVNDLAEGEMVFDDFTYTISDRSDGTGKTATATLSIKITGVDDISANNDLREMTEVMDSDNAQIVFGNVITAIDISNNPTPDTEDSGDNPSVVSVFDKDGVKTDIDADGETIEGVYGSLLIKQDGSYQYLLGDTRVVTNELDEGDMVSDIFTYRIEDTSGSSSEATLTIKINGANDSPTATDDENMVTEGTDGSPAADISGNVIAGDANGGVEDTDPDADDNSTNLTITQVIGDETKGDGAATIADGTTIQGLYGVLTINANGSYDYDLDDDNTTVNDLGDNETLTDEFDYIIRDTGGKTSDTVNPATLIITINGANDFEAIDDVNQIREDDPNNIVTGDVLENDVGVGLTVTHPLNTPIALEFGTLTFTSEEGDYEYKLDNSNIFVNNLDHGKTEIDEFDYTIEDVNFNQTSATLTITIDGSTDVAGDANSNNLTSTSDNETFAGNGGADTYNFDLAGSFGEDIILDISDDDTLSFSTVPEDPTDLDAVVTVEDLEAISTTIDDGSNVTISIDSGLAAGASIILVGASLGTPGEISSLDALLTNNIVAIDVS